MIVGFTGHRPQRLEQYGSGVLNGIKEEITGWLKALRPKSSIVGMAVGVDQLAAGICVALNIPFDAAIPCANQDGRWTEKQKRYYQMLLSRAHKQIMVTEGPPASWKFLKRNKWIVDNCDILIAVWDGEGDGGTSHCVGYAIETGRKLIIIDPRECG